MEKENHRMKSITRNWDWWACLIHREQIEGITEWDDRLIECAP